MYIALFLLSLWVLWIMLYDCDGDNVSEDYHLHLCSRDIFDEVDKIFPEIVRGVKDKTIDWEAIREKLYRAVQIKDSSGVPYVSDDFLLFRLRDKL